MPIIAPPCSDDDTTRAEYTAPCFTVRQDESSPIVTESVNDTRSERVVGTLTPPGDPTPDPIAKTRLRATSSDEQAPLALTVEELRAALDEAIRAHAWRAVETGQTSAPIVADRSEKHAATTTQGDATQPGITATEQAPDSTRDLERAIVQATLAGSHDVARLLADRLRERIATRPSNVVTLKR